jgi:hypothetical protein
MEEYHILRFTDLHQFCCCGGIIDENRVCDRCMRSGLEVTTLAEALEEGYTMYAAHATCMQHMQLQKENAEMRVELNEAAGRMRRLEIKALLPDRSMELMNANAEVRAELSKALCMIHRLEMSLADLEGQCLRAEQARRDRRDELNELLPAAKTESTGSDEDFVSERLVVLHDALLAHRKLAKSCGVDFKYLNEAIWEAKQMGQITTEQAWKLSYLNYDANGAKHDHFLSVLNLSSAQRKGGKGSSERFSRDRLDRQLEGGYELTFSRKMDAHVGTDETTRWLHKVRGMARGTGK